MNKYIKYLENEILYKERLIKELLYLNRSSAQSLIDELNREIIEISIILDKKTSDKLKK